MRRLRIELIRFYLRLAHKLLPKFMKYFKFMGLKLFIPSGVFNPVYTLSTELILKNVRPYGKVADLGSGSGAIAVYIAKNFRAEEIIIYDTDPKASATSIVNARLNNVGEEVKQVSSKEELLSGGGFNYVIINPPYLPIEPRDWLDISWCGGKDLRLFKEVVKLGHELLKEGGVLVLTTSTVSGMDHVLNYLRSLGLKPYVIASAKSLVDTIYLILALKVRQLITNLR